MAMLKEVRAEFTGGRELPISRTGNYTGPDALTAAQAWARERGITLAVHTMILQGESVRMRCSFEKDSVTVPGDLYITPAYVTKPALPAPSRADGGYNFPPGGMKVTPDRE